MVRRADFDTIDLHLIRVLHTVITERSVSRAAMRLASTQPAVSAQLKRLRALTGDPLLVRAGQQMRPTETALQLLDPAARVLHEAERLFSPHARAARSTGFDAAASTLTFRVAASDYLDPLFLPALVAQVKHAAPGVRLELMPLNQDYDYRRHLAAGDVDLVIGNWLQPPGELHLGRLLSDEVVCLVAEAHPAVRPRLERRQVPGLRTRGADAHAPGRAGRHRRAPGRPGRAAQHRGARLALQPDPADGGRQPAGADHRPAVLQPLRRHAAGEGRALPGGLSAADLLPAVARPDARRSRRCAGSASRCATSRASWARARCRGGPRHEPDGTARRPARLHGRTRLGQHGHGTACAGGPTTGC